MQPNPPPNLSYLSCLYYGPFFLPQYFFSGILSCITTMIGWLGKLGTTLDKGKPALDGPFLD